MIIVGLICLLWTAALGWWVFTAEDEPQVDALVEARQRAMEERKKAIYDNLKDLHFEFLAGKLSEEDYQRTRKMLETEAAGVVAELQMARAQ